MGRKGKGREGCRSGLDRPLSRIGSTKATRVPDGTGITLAGRLILAGIGILVLSLGAGLLSLIDGQTAVILAMVGLGIAGAVLGISGLSDRLAARSTDRILGRLMTLLLLPHLLLIAAVGLALIGFGVGRLLGVPGF